MTEDTQPSPASRPVDLGGETVASNRSSHADEPWCPEHGYGCEPQDCPCGHSLRCDCWSIANEH